MYNLKVAIVAGIILLMGATGYAVYVVENHFDYVRALENSYISQGGDIKKLTEENLGLQATQFEPPSK
jgi:hypothetical protein